MPKIAAHAVFAQKASGGAQRAKVPKNAETVQNSVNPLPKVPIWHSPPPLRLCFPALVR
jgi:hypothetical protein